MGNGSRAEGRNVRRTGRLQVDEDLAFQRRTWIVERVGWAAMTLTVLAALLGLFGTGPLSSASVGDPTGALRLEHERFGRALAPTVLRFYVAPQGAASEGELRLWLDRRYLDDVRIERITPEPEGRETAPDRVTFAFRVAEVPDRPVLLTFALKPERFGRLAGRAGTVHGPTLAFDQLVYP